MRPVVDAQAHVVASVRPLRPRYAELLDARGHVLARDVVATRDLPGFDNSAMDGFAVRAADTPGTLEVVDRIAAGRLDPHPLAPGTAVRIMTGAMLPPGADAIVMFEDAQAEGDEVGGRVVLPAAAAGDHVRRAGEDVAIGERVVAAGHRLGAGEMGVLSAQGCVEVVVAPAPRVAILATGDELVHLDKAPRPGEVVDSSAYMLASQVLAAGGAPTYLGIGRDDRSALARLVGRAFGYDAIITTGGVSAGDLDHVLAAIADAGVELEFWKVAMKPGKPFAFGIAPAVGGARSDEAADQVPGVPVFALPGNPVSSWVAFELFVRPALLAMQGAARLYRPRAPVILPAGYLKPAGRAHFLRATLARDGAALIATPHPKQGSAMLSSLVGVQALVEIPAAATAIPPGGTAEALLLEAV